MTDADKGYSINVEASLDSGRGQTFSGGDEGRADGQWFTVESAPKDGTLLELIVDYTDGHGPLQDALIAPTIGWNALGDTGEDRWHIVGWDWCHDHIREGAGEVIGWRPSRLNASDDGIGAIVPIAAIEKDAWQETARFHHDNEFYYRGLLDQIADAIGPEAFRADNGDEMGSPVRARLPDLVRAATRQPAQPVSNADELRERVAVLEAALEPVMHWYQSDEHEARPTDDILRDVVADLQHDRDEVLRLRAALEPFGRWARWALEGGLSAGSDRKLHQVPGMLRDVGDEWAFQQQLSPDEPRLRLGAFRALLAAHAALAGGAS